MPKALHLLLSVNTQYVYSFECFHVVRHNVHPDRVITLVDEAICHFSGVRSILQLISIFDGKFF